MWLNQHAWSLAQGAKPEAKVVSMQHVSFLLLYQIFPSFLHARGKSGMSPGKKTVLREKFGSRHRTAGLGRAGSGGPGWRAGQGWWAWPGWGQGPGRGGVGDVRVPT